MVSGVLAAAGVTEKNRRTEVEHTIVHVEKSGEKTTSCACRRFFPVTLRLAKTPPVKVVGTTKHECVQEDRKKTQSGMYR